MVVCFNLIKKAMNTSDGFMNNTSEGFGMSASDKKKVKKGKKAKRKAKKLASDTEDIFGGIAGEIAQATKRAGGKSICDINNINLIDINELRNIAEDATKKDNEKDRNMDQYYKNIENRNKYLYWINFNEKYKPKLKKYERKLFTTGLYSNDIYEELLKYRIIDNLKDLDENNNLEDKLKTTENLISINNNFLNNKEILEENKKDIQKKINDFKNNFNNTENNILVENRDTNYENEINSYYLMLIQIVLYIYAFFYIIYFFDVVTNKSFSFYNDSFKLIILAFLPTIIFDNIIYILLFIYNLKFF